MRSAASDRIIDCLLAPRPTAYEIEAFQHHGGGEERRHAAHVVGRAHRVDVACDHVEPGQALEKLHTLAGAGATPRGRTDAGRAAGIEEVHVEAQVDGPPAQLRVHVREHVGNATPEQVDAVDDLVALAARVLEDAGHVNRAARTDVDGTRGVDDTFLGGARERGGGVVQIASAAGIRSGVRVDVK